MSDKILIEYEVELNKIKAQLKTVQDSLKGVDEAGKKAAKNTEDSFKKASSSISSNFREIAGALGIAFGTQQIIQFGKEAVQLAAKAEGIRKAFDKLNSPKLLDNLREATKGTVNDLELMKAAVKANNFQLPLEQLATLLKFAQQRAQETGESVEYLTESIVLGISRKSIPILDNLGISSQQVQNEFKKTGDFALAVGNIVNKSLEEQGTLALTTADKMARLTAAWDNFKVSFGEGLIDKSNEYLDILDLITGKLTVNQKVAQMGSQVLVDAQDKANKKVLENALKSEKDRLIAITSVEKQITNIKELGLKEQDYTKKLIYKELLKNEEKFLNQLKTLNKKASTKTVELTEDELKKIRDAEIALRDLKASLIEEEKERELAQLVNKFTDLKEGFKGNADALLALEEKYRQEREAIIKKYDDAELERQKQFHKSIQEGISENAKKTYNIFRQNQKQIVKAQTQAEQEEEERLQLQAEVNRKVIDQRADYIISSLNSINEIASNLDQRRIQEIEDRAANEIAIEQQRYDSGILSREEYDRRVKNINKKADDEAKAIQLAQFKRQKNLALINAAINIAESISKTIAQYPLPAGAPLVALNAALGALQISAIASQPTPKFAKGGEIGGRLHSEGGTLIEAERGEFVINRKDTRTNKDLLGAINKGLSEKYIYENYIAPALKAQYKEYENNKNKSFADNIANSMIFNSGKFNDKNLLESLKQSRRAERDNIEYLAKVIAKQSYNSRNW